MKLILLPGLDGTGDLFQGLVSHLSESLEVVICEYPRDPNLGYPELLSIAESHLPTSAPYVLLGESFSGPISVQIASKNPVGLKGLILVNTFLTDPRPLIGKIARAAPDFMFQKPPKHLLKLVSRESEPGIDVAQALQRVLGKISPELVRARLTYLADLDVIDDALNIRAPTLILRARDDWAVRKNSMSPISNTRVEVHEKVLPGNHFLLQAHPSKTAVLIEEFCSNLDQRSRDEA